jgi:hypothetical protein
MTAPTYTVEYNDEFRMYEVVEWTKISDTQRTGRSVYKDRDLCNAAAMAEEFQYNADVHDWAQRHAAEWDAWNDQLCEFDEV